MLCLVKKLYALSGLGFGGRRDPALGCSCRNAVLGSTDSPQQVGLEIPVLTSINEAKYGLRETFRKT